MSRSKAVYKEKIADSFVDLYHSYYKVKGKSENVNFVLKDLRSVVIKYLGSKKGRDYLIGLLKSMSRRNSSDKEFSEYCLNLVGWIEVLGV